ncbi:hypothetical protein LNO88_14875 [Klebsiella pneumoniae subsp. pneumoniae]|nr:hypothetical protein [Klebsiella pneumoniae subsp. pneumoniae]
MDVPTIRPHKLSMTTMGCQSLVIVRLTRSGTAFAASARSPPSAAWRGVERPRGHLVGDHPVSGATLLKAQPADNLNALTARMNGAIKGNTFAKSAIETALLDARGQSLRSAGISPARRRAANGVAGAVDLSQRRYRERYALKE